MLKTSNPTSVNPLSTLYQPIEADIQRVEERLKMELVSRFDLVEELLLKSNRLSGKRLRPALLLLFARALGNVTEEHITLATAVEMIHTATLIHDDILDGANQRRHTATLHAEYGNQIAILTGDYLFSHAFFLTSTLPTTYPAREIGISTNKICEGEIRQIGTNGKFHLAEEDYIEIIDAKTAALCRCATKLGVYLGDATEHEIQLAAQYGTGLGIAFQIIDDLLDIIGTEIETCKSLGTDLEQRKPTLPLIHLLSQIKPGEKPEFCRQLSAGKIGNTELAEKMDRYGSIQYCKQTAKKFANEAASCIAWLPESAAKKVLKALPEFTLNRVF